MIKSRWPWPAAWLALWMLGACGSSANPLADGALADAPFIDAMVDARAPGPDAAIDARADAAIDAMADAAIDAAIPPDAAIDAVVAVPDAAIDAVVIVPDAAIDARQLDAAVPDAAIPPDAPRIDATVPDAAIPLDAPRIDATVPDSAIPPDAPRIDATIPDSAIPPDAPRIDATVPDATIPPDAAVPPGETRLRLVAGNISSGNGQAYETPGIHIFQGLHPDVAMIQEFNFDGTIRSFVDQAFGPQFAFVRGADGEQIPNGVISRYPILDSGEWIDSQVGNRTYVWARIDIPGPIDLFAISVHLLTRNAPTRATEAGELAQHIRDLPANAYVVLGGDFNTDTRSEAALDTLAPVLAIGGPFPADLAGNDKTNAGRNKPYDWVLASPALEALKTDTVIGANHFAGGFVADTRVYTPIADLAPAVTADSGAPSMQHMAVVRDFLLAGSVAPTVTVTTPNGGEIWQAGTSHTIQWTSNAVASVRVELLIGTMTLTLAASVPAVDGQVTFTVPALATSDARARVTAIGGAASDVSDAPFAITIAPPPEGRVFLNEVLANEPGSDPVGEFVELVNSGALDADLSGWTLSDSVQVRHVFAAGTVLHAGRALVVFGDTAGIPAGLPNAIAASSHALALSNGGDTVTLASPTATIDVLTYDTTLSGTDGVSINRNPDGDPTAPFTLHTSVSMLQRSPGVRADGSAF